jgi:hypothetical protein
MKTAANAALAFGLVALLCLLWSLRGRRWKTLRSVSLVGDFENALGARSEEECFANCEARHVACVFTGGAPVDYNCQLYLTVDGAYRNGCGAALRYDPARLRSPEGMVD